MYVNNDPVNYIDPFGLSASDGSSKWTNNGDGTYTAKAGATLSGLYGNDWQEKPGFTRDPTTLQIGETVGQKNPAATTASPATSPTPGIGVSPTVSSVPVQQTPQIAPSGNLQNTWSTYSTALEVMAGYETVSLGGLLATGGGYAIISGIGVGTVGSSVVGIIAGGGFVAVGIGIIGLGIDMLEGNGIDHTMEFINQLMGKR